MDVDEPPPIAALFSVVFDQKVGYTIAWKRTLPDVDLDGVEYKTLPSGLHGVEQDLVYYVHGSCAGVSAFVRGEGDASQRNARFAAIGALVPLSYGRLGRSWMHADALRDLARTSVEKDDQDTRALELYWKQHQQQEGPENATPASPTLAFSSGMDSRKRKRALSTASSPLPQSSTKASSDHPALCMRALLDTFGPLLFPLSRLALLRKRVLFLAAPPVQQTCNFIYILSILSRIPPDVAETLLEFNTDELLRIQTLFSVGIHDIPMLSDEKGKSGWLACTTDDILGEKSDLWDVLIRMPNVVHAGGRRRWPQIRLSDGTEIKATQRDLRRYHMLRTELERTAPPRRPYRDSPSRTHNENDSEIRPLARTSTAALLDEVKEADPDENLIVESVSWTAMAYNGFMWWASAGEMEAWQNEEARADRQLLEELPEIEDLMRHLGDDDEDSTSEDDIAVSSALATVTTAYFHHLTSSMLQPMADIVEDADDDTEVGIAEAAIAVTSEDIRNMGLDTWSPLDKIFVGEAMSVFFGREAKLEEGGMHVCGVRIC